VFAVQESSSSKREEWYEHKMRLLKQDKRRRGETIGKLLRCLDDMKDQGTRDSFNQSINQSINLLKAKKDQTATYIAVKHMT